MQVRAILEDIEATLAPDTFDPRTETRTFDVMVETYETIVIVAGIVDRVSRAAPNIDLSIRSASSAAITDEIDKGTADIAIGSFADTGDRFMNCRLLSDRYVCVMRAGHPLAAAPMTLAAFLAAPHLVVSMSGGSGDLVDATLAAAGHRRRVALRLPERARCRRRPEPIGPDRRRIGGRRQHVRARRASRDRRASARPAGHEFPPDLAPPAERQRRSHLLRHTLASLGAAALPTA